MHLIWAFLAAVATANAAEYAEKNHYHRKNFFDAFDFIAVDDPTKGKVNYLDRKAASNKGLAGYPKGEDAIFLAVDEDVKNPGGRGRDSVRVASKEKFDKGLFVFDVQHMPQGCGVWPAIWTFGDNWPHNGEIDIIEGVHNSPHNAVALHTNGECTMENSGSMFEGNKDPNFAKLKEEGFCGAPGGAGQLGCSQKTDVPDSFGPGFNNVGGGFYVMEWTDKHIAVWFFKRGTEPKDIDKKPNPDGWPKPMAKFTSAKGGKGCNINERFNKHNIIINTTLCGEWAGSVWKEADKCVARKADSCNEHVLANPEEYKDAFWQIKYIKYFKK